MNLENIDLTYIEQSTITVLHPFIYDTNKIRNLSSDCIIKLKNEELKDFLPYTKNFFGKYHFEESEPKEITFPLITANKNLDSIDFIKDNKIIEPIDINNIKFYLFEKSVGILSITYKLPKNITNEQYLIYHQKLSTLEKRSKQNIKTS